jgi:flagellar basal-body rod protein FlgB
MDKGFEILERIIRKTTFRHKVLASNIANVDTPGYKTKDVPFDSVVKNEVGGLSRTDSAHIQGKSLQGTGNMVAVERPSWEDGNNVALDMELAHMTENALLNEAGTRLLAKKFQMYKVAIKGR